MIIMLNEKAVHNLQCALCDLASEWRGLKSGEPREEEIVRQYNQLLHVLLDWGWDAYLDTPEPVCELPNELMSKRYLIAAQWDIPLNHKGYE